MNGRKLEAQKTGILSQTQQCGLMELNGAIRKRLKDYYHSLLSNLPQPLHSMRHLQSQWINQLFQNTPRKLIESINRINWIQTTKEHNTINSR